MADEQVFHLAAAIDEHGLRILLQEVRWLPSASDASSRAVDPVVVARMADGRLPGERAYAQC